MKAQKVRHLLRSAYRTLTAAGGNENQGPQFTRQRSSTALLGLDYHTKSAPCHVTANVGSVAGSPPCDLPDPEAWLWLNGGILSSNTPTVLPFNPLFGSDRSIVPVFGSRGRLFQSPVESLLTASQLSGNAFRLPIAFLSISRERLAKAEEWTPLQGKDETNDEALRVKKPNLTEEQVAPDSGQDPDQNTARKAGFIDREEELRCETIQGRREWSELGWTREEVLNWPNIVSMARLVSGPLLSWMIVHGFLGSAFVGLVIAGISDWLDGFLARKLNIKTLLGSYLDPIADKILLGSVGISMAYTGLLNRKQPTLWLFVYLGPILICTLAAALVGLIVARDGGLMSGVIVYRAYSLGWQWNDWREVFRIDSGGAAKVEPLLISKLNTVLQLALVAVALLQPALSIEDVYSLVPILSWSVVATTSMSGIAYAYIFYKDPSNLLALRQAAQRSQRSGCNKVF